jgi:hypothetical protein
MSKFLIGAGFAAFTLVFMPGAASAGPIENACLQAHRSGVNRSLCSCIQQVADVTLGGSDQRLAATFFKDPERAQKVHMSQSARDDAFWSRYVSFGQQARTACSG